MPESPRRFVISCGVIAMAAVILPARTAGAATPSVFWVSGTGNSAHANASCPTAGYNSVQSAVTAAETYESSHPAWCRPSRCAPRRGHRGRRDGHDRTERDPAFPRRCRPGDGQLGFR